MGECGRLPATYRRTHGIRYVHGCYSLGDDQRWGVVRRRKGGGDHTLAALKSIRAARPAGAPSTSSWTTCRRTRPPRSARGPPHRPDPRSDCVAQQDYRHVHPVKISADNQSVSRCHGYVRRWAVKTVHLQTGHLQLT